MKKATTESAVIAKLDDWAAYRPGRSWECCFRPDRGWVVRFWQDGTELFEGQGVVCESARGARRTAALEMP